MQDKQPKLKIYKKKFIELNNLTIFSIIFDSYSIFPLDLDLEQSP